MTLGEEVRLEELQSELNMCANGNAMEHMGIAKLEELLSLLIKKTS